MSQRAAAFLRLTRSTSDILEPGLATVQLREGHSNQELRYALGRATPFPGFDRASISPHRAAFDVVVTAAIFEELIKHARWSELVQWSGEPALYTKFHLGKYRGQRYDAIAASDPDYLRWIIEKSELDEGIKHSARHWLAAQS